MKKLTPQEAARLMGKGPQYVRIRMQRGLLPIGIADKTKIDGQKHDYYISPKLFQDYTGIKLPREYFEEV